METARHFILGIRRSNSDATILMSKKNLLNMQTNMWKLLTYEKFKFIWAPLIGRMGTL